MARSGAAVQTCPNAHDCRAIWDKVEAEKKRVDAIGDAQK